MKNILKTIIFLILIFNCYSVSAQIQREQLVGTWVFDYESSMVNMDEKAKKVQAKSPTLQGRLERSYKNRQITLFDNGIYLLRLPGGKQVEGNWTVHAVNGNRIIIKTETHVQNFIIVRLSQTELVLRLINDGKAKPMFATWYFTKQ